LAVSVGVKVAVIVAEPPPVTVAVALLSETTLAFDVAYAQLPGSDPVTEGAVNTNAASPYVFVTPDQVNDGVAFATVTVIVTVPPET